METTIQVEGMSCMHCVNAVTEILEEIQGVKVNNIDLEANKASINISENTPIESIINHLNNSGIYTASKSN